MYDADNRRAAVPRLGYQWLVIEWRFGWPQLLQWLLVPSLARYTLRRAHLRGTLWQTRQLLTLAGQLLQLLITWRLIWQ